MAKKDPVLSSDDVLGFGAIENGSTSRWYRVPRRWYLVKDRTGIVFGFWAVLEHAHGDRFGDFHRDTRRRAASNKVSLASFDNDNRKERMKSWFGVRLQTI